MNTVPCAIQYVLIVYFIYSSLLIPKETNFNVIRGSLLQRHIKIKDIKKRKEVVCHYLKFIGSEFVCELLWEQTLQGQACVVCGWWATCFSRPWAEMSLFVVHSSFLGLISSGVSGLFHSFSVPFSSEHLECSSGFIWWWRYRCDMHIQSRGGGCRERGLKRPPVLQPPLHSLGSFSSGSQVGWCGL